MGIFENNIDILKKVNPELFEKIKTFGGVKNYSTVTSLHPKQYPNLYHKPSMKYAYNHNDPLTPILQYLKANIKVPQLNIFFGFGLGYEVIGFQQNYAANDSVMVVIDPDIEPFYHTINTIDITPLLKDKRVFLLVGLDEKDLFVRLHSILMIGNLKLYVKAINIISNQLSTSLHIDYYKKAMGHLKDAVKEVLLHYGNDPWDSLIGIENTFLNINEIINNPGIIDLKDAFKGKPGIVVSTGPSLNKNIHLLKGLENKAVICAADASLRVMRRHNLKPHMVTSLERVLPVAKLFEGLTKEDVEGVYLSACPVIRPETYENFPGKRVIVYRNFATFKWLEIEKGTLDIGPSAGNMAFKVLEFLGCNPIILIGQDLAFGENELTHASGTTYGEKQEAFHTQMSTLEVEGNYQHKIKTTDVWYKFLKYYEKDISEFNGEVINATEGGAKIHGTKIMTFAEAIDNYIKNEFDPLGTISSSLKYPSEEEIYHQRMKMINKVEDAIKYSREVIEEFQYGDKICSEFVENVIKKHDNNEPFDEKYAGDLFIKLQKPLAKMSEQKFYEIFMHFVQSYYMTTFVEINGVKASSLPPYKQSFSIVTLLHDMYAVMIKLIEAMEKSLKEMREKLESGAGIDVMAK